MNQCSGYAAIAAILSLADKSIVNTASQVKTATCHPDRKHKAKGLCSACYKRRRYAADPEKSIGYVRKYHAKNPEKTRERWRAASRKFRAENPEKQRQYDLKYYAENTDKRREYERNRRVKNYDKSREACRKYRAANPEKARESGRKYYAKNPEVFRARDARRIASIRTSVNESPTAKQIATLMKDPCVYCGAKSEHMDHVIPLARGGDHNIDNLVPACAKCNLSKGSKLPAIEWNGRK